MRKTTVVCLLLALQGSHAHAAPLPSHAWQVIDRREGGGHIELDKARIGRMPDGNTAAWSRLNLGFDIPDVNTGIRYNAIEALNSYNCSKREYSTLKRIYVDGKGKTVREEVVEHRRNVEIVDGSFEEKLLPHVCKPRAVGQMKDLAEQLVQVMAPPPTTAKPKSGVANAAVNSKTTTPATVAVADNKIKGNQTRLIDLPKIDPETVDNPVPKPLPAKPGEPEPAAAKTAPAKSKTAEKSPPPPSTAKKATSAEPAPSDLAPNYHSSAVSRAEIERQLATFGPRKRSATPKKTVDVVKDIHWSYEGKGGPENWAKLSPNNATCANGKRQSPINISDGIRVDLEPIKFNYGLASYSVIDNGHTVQVNIAEGHSIRIMEHDYQLLQFHFHKPSEERVNGRSYDMVAHFVHKDADGRLAVVAVLFEGGMENPQIQSVWNNLPLEQGMLVAPSALLDLSKILPEKRDYWTYMGSLTTPPCSEDVLWMVMKQPQQVSAEQVAIFGRLYPNNARPVQATNNRLIKGSR